MSKCWTIWGTGFAPVPLKHPPALPPGAVAYWIRDYYAPLKAWVYDAVDTAGNVYNTGGWVVEY